MRHNARLWGPQNIFNFWGERSTPEYLLPKCTFWNTYEGSVRERCSLRSRLCLCSAKFLYRMGSAYRLHRRTCYTKKEPPRRISEVLKVAATYSPTIFRSAVPSAMLCVGGSAASLPRPLPRAAGAHTAARPAPLMHFSQPNDHPSLMTT